MNVLKMRLNMATAAMADQILAQVHQESYIRQYEQISTSAKRLGLSPTGRRRIIAVYLSVSFFSVIV